jgi:hypothetical protein
MDRRRVALDQILWQAPAIIVAAQAFLLPVLAREGIAISARALILVAGVAASVTGIVGVKRQRVQELFLNKQIWELFRAEGLEVPRRRRHRIPIFMLWIQLSRPSSSSTSSRS